MKKIMIFAIAKYFFVTTLAFAQTAPPGTANKPAAIDFNRDFTNAKGNQQYPCEAGSSANAKQKAFCETPMTRADIIADALNTPETDAQNKPLPVDAKHARNMALAYQILQSKEPMDLTQDEKDRIREAVFYAYRGAVLFNACIIVATVAECSVAPAK